MLDYAMSDYILYYSPDSANLIVRMALQEADVAYEARLVDRSRGEQRSSEFLRLNPQGLLPVLVHRRATTHSNNGSVADTVLFETAAICLYLIDRHPLLGPGINHDGRGDLYRWLFYISNTLHADLRIRFYAERYMGDRDAGHLRDMVSERILGHLQLLDRHIAAHNGIWMLDSGFSALDLYLGVCCRWLMLYPAGYPVAINQVSSNTHVWRLLTALEKRPAVARACNAEWIKAPFFINPSRAEPAEGSVLG